MERVGGGGMAEVYLAKQKTAFDRPVAVKVIRKGYADDEDFRARFLREAQAVAKLSHPHILQLIEFGEGGDNGELLYLVMPYVSGGTLRDRIKANGGPLQTRETLRFFTQLCEAIEYAHNQNLIHRDIKPSNVLMQDQRNILLADFGIALDQGDPRLTITGMGLGTAEYMAPEQARGQADKRSDIYSLGVVLFVMLTGHAPYTGPTPFDVLMKQANDAIPPLSRYNPSVPPKIEEVMQTAMAKQPDDRFRSVGALLNALEDAQTISGINMGSSNVMQAVRPSDLAAGGGNPTSQPSAGPAPATPPLGASGPYTPPAVGSSGPASTPSYSPPSDQVPTVRVGQMSASSPHAAVTPADLQAANAARPDATHLAPSTGAGTPPVPYSGTVAAPGTYPGSMAASNPSMPAVQVSAPPANYATPPGGYSAPPSGYASAGTYSTPLGNPPTPVPPVISEPPKPPTTNNRTVIALVVALVILLMGSTAASVIFFLNLNKGSHPPAVITGKTPTTATVVATATHGPLTFLTGTPCSQAAANPIGPTPDHSAYLPVAFIDSGKGGPAYVAVHHDGSLYYTDQAQRGIYALSSALIFAGNHSNHLVGSALGLPSGITITPDQTAQIYYLYQGISSGKPNVQAGVFDKVSGLTSTLITLNDLQAGGGANFALAVNPSNNALLIPSGTSGTLYCLGIGNAQPQAVVTGLKNAVAAIADSSGNIYVADLGANEILRFPAKGSGPDWRQKFDAPADLVLDSQGYLLATLQGTGPGTGSVVRIDPKNGTLLDTLVSGLGQPLGITFDTSMYHSGTVYFVDQKANKIFALCQDHNGICP
jgi:serine/threonine protein kinase